METFTTSRSIGQLLPQVIVRSQLAGLTADISTPFILYHFVVQEIPWQIGTNLPNVIDQQMLAQLYAEFADEDRELANAGLNDYGRLLANEDREK